MVTIRLARHGAKKNPFYHITVADRAAKRDGRFIERIGFFSPLARGQSEPLRVNLERADYWLSAGAQPSERVRQLLKRARAEAGAEARNGAEAQAEAETEAQAEAGAETAAETEVQAEAEAEAGTEAQAEAAAEAQAEAGVETQAEADAAPEAQESAAADPAPETPASKGDAAPAKDA